MAKLKVQGSATGTGTVTLVAPTTDSTRTITLPDDTQTLIGTNTSGNVGIGTSSPSTPLHVAGNLLVETGSPDIYLGTSNPAHKNWRLACQETANNTFEIASGTATAGASAQNDTYTVRFKVDDSGRVTMPYQPAFCAYRSSSYGSASGDHEVDINVASVNRGNHYSTSTNRFTAPVAGLYKFDAAISFYHTTATTLQTQDDSQYLTFRKNGVEINGRNAGSQSAMMNSGALTKSGVEASTTFTAILNLSAGDYVSVEYGDIQSPVTISNANFNGYLIG